MRSGIRHFTRRLIAASLAVCALQSVEATAGVIMIGSPQWERLQAISVTAESQPEPATQVNEHPPWRRPGSLGAAGASVPVVQTRRDDLPPWTHDSRHIALAPSTRRHDVPPGRLPPPRDGGVFRPPEAVPTPANVV